MELGRLSDVALQGDDEAAGDGGIGRGDTLVKLRGRRGCQCRRHGHEPMESLALWRNHIPCPGLLMLTSLKPTLPLALTLADARPRGHKLSARWIARAKPARQEREKR